MGSLCPNVPNISGKLFCGIHFRKPYPIGSSTWRTNSPGFGSNLTLQLSCPHLWPSWSSFGSGNAQSFQACACTFLEHTCSLSTWQDPYPFSKSQSEHDPITCETSWTLAGTINYFVSSTLYSNFIHSIKSNWFDSFTIPLVPSLMT